MCGIVGSICQEDARVRLEKSMWQLSHRGPDMHKAEVLDLGSCSAHLGHTRLAIQDLSEAGTQPFFSKDGQWIVVFNGEIYNHYSIRQMMDHDFRTTCDTETLVESLSKYGVEKTLSLLNGIYAFAALNTESKELFLIRDPYGVKPLYYTCDNNKISFSSEISALLTISGVEKDIDLYSLYSCLSVRYSSAPNTIFKNVKKLKVNEILKYNVKTHKYEINKRTHTLPYFLGNETDAIHEYGKLFREAVHRQLLSDAPIGIFLSGGVDSALIASEARKASENISCFTIDTMESSTYSEAAYARQTAKSLGLPFKEIKVSADDLLKAIPLVAKHNEEPVASVSSLLLWYLCKESRPDIAVAISGQGADEIWGGYLKYKVEYLRNKFSPVMPLCAKILNKLPNLPSKQRRLYKTVAADDLATRMIESSRVTPSFHLQNLMGIDFEDELLKQFCFDGSSSTTIEQMMSFDEKNNLPEELLLYSDKISMAHSLELRVPMLDIQLSNFVRSLPLEYKLTISKQKYLHKKFASRHLSDGIVNRSKLNFNFPISNYLRTNWKKEAEEMLFDDTSHLESIIDFRYLKKMWQDFISEKNNNSQLFFMMMSFSCYTKIHLFK